MKHLDLLNEFRELIAQLRFQVEAASAMETYDTHKVAENVICGLMRELCGWPDIRNLNPEQANFPGIDLADDSARIAVQVTATADLAKVKHTVEMFVGRDLNQRYSRLIVYVLTSKQGSYSQTSIDASANGKLQFSAGNDVWDFQDLCSKASAASPQKPQAAINHLKAYLRGIPIGLADEDFDPPANPSESLLSNLVELYFPKSLFVAGLNSELVALHGKRRPGQMRKTIREFNQTLKKSVPSGYVDHGGMLMSFMDLTLPTSPYRHLVEPGTAEEHKSADFSNIDDDRERVFKALLRSSLQQRLYQEHVRWEHEDRQFIFLPREEDQDQRLEGWQGETKATRTVYGRKYSKKDTSKVFQQKHLSFAVEFIRFGEDWLMAITPSWFFSYGDDFKKSHFASENLSWVKRHEANQAVMNHFRFIAAWLRSMDEEDLFTSGGHSTVLSFGDILTLDGAPSLDESKWGPLPVDQEADEENTSGRLFD